MKQPNIKNLAASLESAIESLAYGQGSITRALHELASACLQVPDHELEDDFASQYDYTGHVLTSAFNNCISDAGRADMPQDQRDTVIKTITKSARDAIAYRNGKFYAVAGEQAEIPVFFKLTSATRKGSTNITILCSDVEFPKMKPRGKTTAARKEKTATPKQIRAGISAMSEDERLELATSIINELPAPVRQSLIKGIVEKWGFRIQRKPRAKASKIKA